MMTEPARFTRPHPELLFGDGPASDGVYWPTSSTAPLIRSALITAAGGSFHPFLVRVSRRTAAQPAVSGVAMLVPPSNQYAPSDEVPYQVSTFATALESVDRMHVPGATTSGLIRPSGVGPRLLNAATPSGLASVPLFPAQYKITMSWCCQTKSSISVAPAS